VASFVLKNVYLEYGGTTMTSFLESITMNIEADAPEDTAMGDDWRSFLSGGLKVGSFDMNFNQSFAASEVDATLWSLVGTSAAFLMRPTTAAVGATNPQFTGVGIITSYAPVTGSAGDKANAPLSVQCKSTVNRATA